MMRALTRTAVAIAMTAIFAAPAFAQGTKPDPKPDPKLVQQGQKVFAENKCTMCHSIEGKGNKAGVLDGVGSRLTEAEIREWLVNPAEMMKKAKPAPKRKVTQHPKLSPENLDALVAYLRSLREPAK
jgi:mono/diheme cytochrome c family protein